MKMAMEIMKMRPIRYLQREKKQKKKQNKRVIIKTKILIKKMFGL